MGTYIDRSRTYLHNGRECRKGEPFEMDDSVAGEMLQRYGTITRLPNNLQAPGAKSAPEPAPEPEPAPPVEGKVLPVFAKECGGGWWEYEGKKYRVADLPANVVPESKE